MSARRRLFLRMILCAALLGAVAGCAPNAPPGGSEVPPTSGEEPPPTGQELPEDPAMDLWQRISQQDYQSWPTAPDYDTPQPATGPHGEEVQIFVNQSAKKRLDERDAGGLPVGAIVVKDAYVGGALDSVSVMEKVESGAWYWAEYHADGTVIIEGLETPSCAECHSAGKDFVRSFDVP